MTPMTRRDFLIRATLFALVASALGRALFRRWVTTYPAVADVPPWVLDVTRDGQPTPATFGTPVLVVRHAKGASVYPRWTGARYDHIVRIGGAGGMYRVSGGPVTFYGDGMGDCCLSVGEDYGRNMAVGYTHQGAA